MPRIGAHIHVDNPLAEAIACGADAVQFFLGVATGYHGPLPALGIAEEELDRVRADGDRLGERVSEVDVGSDARHAPSLPTPRTHPWTGRWPVRRTRR